MINKMAASSERAKELMQDWRKAAEATGSPEPAPEPPLAPPESDAAPLPAEAQDVDVSSSCSDSDVSSSGLQQGDQNPNLESGAESSVDAQSACPVPPRCSSCAS